MTGIKEDIDKLEYELDWEFIEKMAVRMQKNKDKYPKFNWKNKIEINKLYEALTRHFISLQKGEKDDEEVNYGHIIAIACNAMMIYYQEKIYKNE